MYVKANPVLSKMFAHSGGLTLNEKGLFFHSKTNPNFYFLITDDHEQIVEIMEFDYGHFERAKDYIDFFNLLLTNKFFRPSRFLVDPSEGKCKMLKNLAEFLAENPIQKGYTTRQLEDMFEPLAKFNFESKYNLLVELEKNQTKLNQKLNGGVILKHKPDFDKRNLQRGFEYFNNKKFETYFDRLSFLNFHAEENLVEEFVNMPCFDVQVPDEIKKQVLRLDPSATFDKGVIYSNLNYDTLGDIINAHSTTW